MEGGKVREGSLANEGTSIRGMDNNFLFLGVWVCVSEIYVLHISEKHSYTLYINSSTIFFLYISKIIFSEKISLLTSTLLYIQNEHLTFEYTDFKLNEKPSFLSLILNKTNKPKATNFKITLNQIFY